jgi:hypothetical protein
MVRRDHNLEKLAKTLPYCRRAAEERPRLG